MQARFPNGEKDDNGADKNPSLDDSLSGSTEIENDAHRDTLDHSGDSHADGRESPDYHDMPDLEDVAEHTPERSETPPMRSRPSLYDILFEHEHHAAAEGPGYESGNEEDDRPIFDLGEILNRFNRIFQTMDAETLRKLKQEKYERHLEELNVSLERIKQTMLELKHAKVHLKLEQNAAKLEKLALEASPSEDYKTELLREQAKLTEKHKKITAKEAEIHEQQHQARPHAHSHFGRSFVVFAAPRNAAASAGADESINNIKKEPSSPSINRK